MNLMVTPPSTDPGRTDTFIVEEQVYNYPSPGTADASLVSW